MSELEEWRKEDLLLLFLTQWVFDVRRDWYIQQYRRFLRPRVKISSRLRDRKWRGHHAVMVSRDEWEQTDE